MAQAPPAAASSSWEGAEELEEESSRTHSIPGTRRSKRKSPTLPSVTHNTRGIAEPTGRKTRYAGDHSGMSTWRLTRKAT
jgi:hypothetical protein